MRKDEGNTWRKRSRSEEEKGKRPESRAGRGTSNVFSRGDKERGRHVGSDSRHETSREKRAFKGDSEEVLLDPV